ncbi:MAG TPA: hypothetical protein VK306_02355 [Acidimicrobiales bacterium]|nr:hypothetical protein [Acidimicrobiales bacterium]
MAAPARSVDKGTAGAVAVTVSSGPPPEDCANGVDDDGDGFIDGNDPECSPD